MHIHNISIIYINLGYKYNFFYFKELIIIVTIDCNILNN